MMAIRITLNGETREVIAGISLQALLTQLNIASRRIAVEHNLQIVDPERFDQVPIKAGDRIEIIGFVGGGRW